MSHVPKTATSCMDGEHDDDAICEILKSKYKIIFQSTPSNKHDLQNISHEIYSKAERVKNKTVQNRPLHRQVAVAQLVLNDFKPFLVCLFRQNRTYSGVYRMFYQFFMIELDFLNGFYDRFYLLFVLDLCVTYLPVTLE